MTTRRQVPLLATFGEVPVRIFAAGEASRAAVLLFHGLRSSADTLDDVGRAIASAGMTAVLADAPHHGARRSTFLETMPDTSTREGYRRLLAILREARDEVPTLVDHLRAEGYAKVAIAGVSLGGFIALSGGAAEPRVDAIASLLGSPDWAPHEGDAARPDALLELAEAIAEGPIHRAESFPPRPLLLLNGAHDVNVRPEPARALVARLEPLYAQRGRSGALVHREYDVPHFVPPDVWAEMVATTVSFLASALIGERFRGGAAP